MCIDIAAVSLITQFGDEKEALYFIANDIKEKNEWMSKLKQGNLYVFHIIDTLLIAYNIM